jgi:hypothetical protein
MPDARGSDSRVRHGDIFLIHVRHGLALDETVDSRLLGCVFSFMAHGLQSRRNDKTSPART